MKIRYGRDWIALPPNINVRDVYRPHEMQSVPDPAAEIARAFNEPINAAKLSDLAKPTDRVTIVVSDMTRGMPRELMLCETAKQLAHVPDENITLAVAYGKHPAEPLSRLGISDEWEKRFRVVHHDAKQAGSHAELKCSGGVCSVNRAAVEADVVLGLGAVRPHYFAGFTGGAKSIVPGLASASSIAANHALRDHPRSRLGIIEGNAARKNQEDLAGLLAGFVICNVATNGDGELVKAAYGHFIDAHRALVPIARGIGQMPVKRADIVIAGAAAPTSVNIYQITKAVAIAAKVVATGGTLIICGPCEEGVGDLHAVNEIIYRHTLTRYLRKGARCVLVSELSKDQVEQTFFTHAPNLPGALKSAMSRYENPSVAVLPNTGYLIPVNDEDEPLGW